MKQSKVILIVLTGFLMTACATMNVSQIKSTYTAIPESPKVIDIPKYDDARHGLNGYPYVYWHFCKQKQAQLGLVSPETASDSLIFRVWITNPIGSKGQPHGLIEIKYDSSKWVGALTLMSVNFNRNKISETITKHKVIELVPLKTSWGNVIDSLYKYKIDILPTDEKIPNYYKENEGYNNNAPTFSFEYSTKNVYRFYQYSDIYRASDKFWQADNVVKLLDLLEEEFKWDSLGRDYFK